MKHIRVIRPLARADMDAAYEWYETFTPGRGEKFAVELRAMLVEIRDAPYRKGGLVSRKVRAARLKRSKFIVYYKIEGEFVMVIAVQHARAHPNKWRRRK